MVKTADKEILNKKVKAEEIAEATSKIATALESISEMLKGFLGDDSVRKTEQLATISKRREEVKDKLEAGQLKADEAADLSAEYKKLGDARKKLLNGEQ
ncbi:MAG: hypothetical protein JRC68_10090 [Deltaproteobacteria bacterium]|nr:hypothetical protein [Deltaproteobacteria bacterium]